MSGRSHVHLKTSPVTFPESLRETHANESWRTTGLISTSSDRIRKNSYVVAFALMLRGQRGASAVGRPSRQDTFRRSRGTVLTDSRRGVETSCRRSQTQRQAAAWPAQPASPPPLLSLPWRPPSPFLPRSRRIFLPAARSRTRRAPRRPAHSRARRRERAPSTRRSVRTPRAVLSRTLFVLPFFPPFTPFFSLLPSPRLPILVSVRSRARTPAAPPPPPPL